MNLRNYSKDLKNFQKVYAPGINLCEPHSLPPLECIFLEGTVSQKTFHNSESVLLRDNHENED